MNYRHIFHAGNFADVFKHIVLTRVIAYMQKKDAAFRVLDTHAGLGVYDLSSEQAQKTGEWKTGIGKVLDAAEKAPAEVREGDRVEVITRDSENFEFSVSEINEIGLGGKFGFIPYDKMRSLSVRKPGSEFAGAAYWIGILLGTALFVAVIANADSVSVCSPGPCPNPTP